MYLIINLPESLCGLILTEWCRFTGVGKLDSSFCSHESRSEFLKLLKCGIFNENVFNVKVNFYKWIINRSIKCANYSCNDLSRWDLLCEKFDTSKITQLQFSFKGGRYIKEEKISSFINRCLSLKSLTFGCAIENILFFLDTQIMNQLDELDVTNLDPLLTNSTIQYCSTLLQSHDI
jgi:hypothetical protein